MARGWIIGLCWVLALLLLAARSAPVASQESVALHCARGNVADYPDAEFVLRDRGARVVHVTFVGYRPSAVRAEWSLRDCLRTAAKYDDSRDIVGKLWYRDPQLRSRQEPLETGSDPRRLIFSAATGKIVRRAAATP